MCGCYFTKLFGQYCLAIHIAFRSEQQDQQTYASKAVLILITELRLIVSCLIRDDDVSGNKGKC